MKKTVFRNLRGQDLIENYNRFRKTKPSKLPKKISIWDETLMEGERTPTVFLTYSERVRLAQALDEIGVAVINVGFPGFSDEERNNVRKLSNESFEQAKLAVFSRIRKSDVDACLSSSIRQIAISTAFNDLNLKYVLKKSREEILNETKDMVEYAKKHGLLANFILEDASRTPIEEILTIFDVASKAGADRLGLEDSVGILRPLSTKYMFSKINAGLKELKLDKIPLSIKCHNDFGLATANTLAAIEEGVTYPQVCVAGYGERTGLAPLEEVVVAFEQLYSRDTGIDAHRLYRVTQLVEKSYTWPLPFHKPIVGDDAFSHASDKQVSGMMSHPLAFEPFPPKMIDRETTLYMGRHLGEASVKTYMDLHGVKATPQQIAAVAEKVRRSQPGLDKGAMMLEFYEIKKSLKQLRRGMSEEDLKRIIRQVTRQRVK